MKYRINSRNNDKLSILGFGCMRFPKDEEEAKNQIIYAIENGINYFDTAYAYPKSEEILGKVLAKGYRKSVKVATKLPHYLIKQKSDLDKIFNEQLRRLQTNYIDYYLIHVLTDVAIWERLVSLGIIDWVERKKRLGEIKNIGFSYHGGQEDFIKLIDIYDWEFCLIQYNYFDENNQAGRKGLEYAHQKNVPVMIMEPLRGGQLVNQLPKEVYLEFANANQKRTPVEWSLKWLWNHSEILTVLSGMNSKEMIKENIEIADRSEANQLTEENHEMFGKIKKILWQKMKVPCTGCNYCMPCPVNVDIPTCFSCYNDLATVGKLSAIKKYLMQTSLKTEASNASLCIECRKCEKKCPQNILISERLQEVSRHLEGWYYRPIRFGIKKILKVKR